MKIKTFLEHSSSSPEDEIHDRFESEYGVVNNSKNRQEFSHKLSAEGKYDVPFIKKTLTDRPFTFKSKEQLDRMNEKQVDDYSYSILTNNANYMSKQEREQNKAQSDWKQYLAELDIYIATRFKSTIYKKYDEYIIKSKDNSITGNDRKTYKLLADILTDKGYSLMYNAKISSYLDKIDDFKYIFGLEIDGVKLVSKKE